MVLEMINGRKEMDVERRIYTLSYSGETRKTDFRHRRPIDMCFTYRIGSFFKKYKHQRIILTVLTITSFTYLRENRLCPTDSASVTIIILQL